MTWSSRWLGRRLAYAGGAALAAAICISCRRSVAAAGTEPFRLTLVRPANPEGLFLNEELVFYFSEEVDPTSVSSASVEIVSEGGLPARGSLRIEVDEVRFVPAPVLARDLSDGGYLPGARYTVTLAGFPRPDGLRSARGAVLEKTRTWSFRTVEVHLPATGLVFEDKLPEKVGFLRLFPAAAGQGAAIESQGSIYLACDKPLDPSSVREEAFRLYSPEERREVGLRVRLVENHVLVAARPRPASVRSSAPADAWERERRSCVVELTPKDRLRAGADWELRLAPGRGGSEPPLRDFGGRPVLLDSPSSVFQVHVSDPATDAGRGALREEFDTIRFQSPIEVPGYDGTAQWKETGRVEIRYPAAAGNGADGPVVLGGRFERTDLQALSIEVGAGETCSLPAEPGLVVLRCQGRMSIQGTIGRKAPFDEEAEKRKDPTLVEWTTSKTGSTTLSRWLELAAERKSTWTVLIAGGDLVIQGTVGTTTPLLLVSGGMIRVSGSVEAPFVFRLGEGGGTGSLSPGKAKIQLDTPAGPNPLARKLRFAALSGLIPPRGEVLRWLPPEVGGSRTGWRILYLRELPSASPAPEDFAAVDSPVRLDPPGPIQFLVELELEPSESWNPPWVDFVHLAWEQPPARAGAAGGGR